MNDFDLARFPSFYDESKPLLHVNSPFKQLKQTEPRLKQKNDQSKLFFYEETQQRSHIPSFLRFIYRYFYLEPSEHWQISQRILDSNYLRLYEVKRQRFRLQEWPLALEIYLQIDVDSFYVKTSSTREIQGARSIFIEDDLDVRYLVLPCENSTCPCCYPLLDISKRTTSSILFAYEKPYEFVNGYRSYLNGHASCRTKHFLYTLKCPCGQYDYLDSSHQSNETLKDVFMLHRRESVRILHEFLLGPNVMNEIQRMNDNDNGTIERSVLNRCSSRLYQHLTECSSAIQLLLNCSEYYWCFVPISDTDIEQDRRPFDDDDNDERFHSSQERTDDEVNRLMAHVRSPPSGTSYTRKQIEQQRRFFKYAFDRLFLPPRHLDIFTFMPIYLFREDSSLRLVEMLKTFLLERTDCRLNSVIESETSSSSSSL